MERLDSLAGLKPRRHARTSPVTDFRRLWPLILRDRFLLLGAAAFQTVSVACDTAAIQVFSYLTDELLTARDIAAFRAPAAVWLAVAVVGAGAVFLTRQLTTRAGETFRLRCRDQVFRHAQRLPPDFIENRGPGDLLPG